MHVAVLPGAEPEQDNVKIVFTGAFDDGIHIAPVKLSLLRFHLLPIDGSFDGVRVQLGERIPDGRQLRWPAAGVVHLTAENQVRLPVDEQRPSAAFLDKPRRFGGVGDVAHGEDE